MGAQAPQRRTQQQRREETRSKLILAAFELIRDKGASKFTTAEVAEMAGLTRGAVQYHFSSPYELLREVVIKVVDDMTAQLDHKGLQTVERLERLEQIVDIYWDGYKSDTYAVFMELAVNGRLNPEMSDSIREALSTLEIKRDAQWLKLIHDFDAEDAEKISWRASLLVILRGLALRKMFAETEEDVERLFRVVKANYIQSILIRVGLIEIKPVLDQD
ncbi:TetR/AcrR family transcriptional regulator [Sneathiella limimaris]|uniref:TetR/AcrR family transcriptional regulator n=1 Tax=Sneathiella limimaris TaxID=1964213 RepID=UPI00146A2BBC|nr:TetR/AcrR family transcriptional regulator [Sneathiella limimaris]